MESARRLIVEKGPLYIRNELLMFREVVKDESKIYKVLVDNFAMRWLVPVNVSDPAIYIYQEIDLPNKHKPKNAPRYKFRTEDGGYCKLYELWHSDANALFRSTGYDVRGCYYVDRIIALERSKHHFNHQYYSDIVHLSRVLKRDETKTIEKISQEKSDKYGLQFYWAEQTKLNTRYGFTTPEKRQK